MKLRAIFLAGMMVTSSYAEQPTKTVNTFGNKIGIADTDQCYFEADSNTIKCTSGKEFKNFKSIRAALTGTPGYIIYKDRKFIGTMVVEPSTGMPGSGTRLDFICDDACE